MASDGEAPKPPEPGTLVRVKISGKSLQQLGMGIVIGLTDRSKPAYRFAPDGALDVMFGSRIVSYHWANLETVDG